jgi:hypothetical protein
MQGRMIGKGKETPVAGGPWVDLPMHLHVHAMLIPKNRIIPYYKTAVLYIISLPAQTPSPTSQTADASRPVWKHC